MPEYHDHFKWQQVRGKRHTHWGILTLVDLPNKKAKYKLLVAAMKGRFISARDLTRKPAQIIEDYSI